MEELSKVTNIPKGLPKERAEKHLLPGTIRRCKVIGHGGGSQTMNGGVKKNEEMEMDPARR